LLHALSAGAQGFLTKPFTLQQIQARVVSLLRADNKTISPQP
jgi:DNA-binding response OmpR family regulator